MGAVAFTQLLMPCGDHILLEFRTTTAHWVDFTPTCLPCLNFPHLSYDVYCFSIPSNSVPLSLVFVWNFPPPLQNSSIFAHLAEISRSWHLLKLQLLNRLAVKRLHISFSLAFMLPSVSEGPDTHDTRNK